MIKISLGNFRNFRRALIVTFGANQGRSLAFLSLLTLRALSVPLLVWLTGYIAGMITSTEPLNTERCIIIGLLWLASLSMGSALSPWINYLQAAIADASLRTLQTQLIKSVMSVPDISMLEDRSFHDDMTFAQQCLGYMPQSFIWQLGIALQGIMGVGALIIVIAQASWLVAIIIFLFIIPHTLVMRSLIKYRYGFARQTHQEWREAQYCASSMSNPSFAKESRLFGNQEFFSNKSSHYFSNLKKLLSTAKLKGTTYPIPTLLLLQAGSVLAFLILLTDFRAGHIGIAAIVIVLQSLYAIQGQLESTVGTYHVISRYLLNFKAIFRVFDIKSAIAISDHPLSISLNDPIDVWFDNVCFSYPGGPRTLNGLSFRWTWGENIALVGENGGGKSTIVKLLLRFYDPDAGVIYINNHPLADYDIDQWRAIIAPVFQDFGRYEYSIRENIYFANTSAKAEETAAILESCGLSELVKSLPHGLETRLGRSFGTTDLSGGQWQKLAIARALSKPSSIMILDEPTAALDPNIESDIYRLFEKLSDNKSSLMITHRLGSTKMADVIMVLDKGHIVESGSHQDLISLDGLYAKMYRAQADWYGRERV